MIKKNIGCDMGYDTSWFTKISCHNLFIFNGFNKGHVSITIDSVANWWQVLGIQKKCVMT
jgi:hypothetical protein